MLNIYWLFLPFFVLMFFTAADEVCFHRKRGLPRWERIGHPLDTLTVILCLAWILYVPPTHRTVAAFLALAVFSCVFVTKDEPVHKRCCSAAEMWLHAVMFLLHPIMLTSAGLIWPAIWSASLSPFTQMGRASGFERLFLIIICVMMICFGIYQFVFWNMLWRPQKAA